MGEDAEGDGWPMSQSEGKPCERKWLGRIYLIQTANENIIEIVELGLFRDTDAGCPLLVNCFCAPLTRSYHLRTLPQRLFPPSSAVAATVCR